MRTQRQRKAQLRRFKMMALQASKYLAEAAMQADTYQECRSRDLLQERDIREQVTCAVHHLIDGQTALEALNDE